MNYFITSTSITVNFEHGLGTHSIPTDHPNADEVRSLLKEEWPMSRATARKVFTLLSSKREILQEQGILEVGEGTITLTFPNGESIAMAGPIYDRLSDNPSEAEFKAAEAFLNRCAKNPRPEAIIELYGFLSHNGLPILPDGRFVGYKGVTSRFLDKHTNSINNRIGQINEMARDQVDSNPNQSCSTGFHVGSAEYVQSFVSGDDITILVIVAPEDVVSVPYDYNNQKLRCAKYTVMAAVPRYAVLPHTLGKEIDIRELTEDGDDDEQNATEAEQDFSPTYFDRFWPDPELVESALDPDDSVLAPGYDDDELFDDDDLDGDD